MTNILYSKYCTFLVSLFATILSFADPMTDIVTLVEFYRNDHKTWFAVGLAFVVLPCVAFFVLMSRFKSSSGEVYVCGFNPFSSAWVRLKICWSNFRKCCWDANSNDDNEDINKHSNWARLLEAVFESAPQFIIQLYAMSVQQEPVKIIQMISLPVSLLSLGWAFTAYDSDPESRPVEGIIVLRNVKQKVVLFVNDLFLLSSRLFAVAFFTITYKWWIISVLMIHSVLIVIVDTIWSYRITKDFNGNCSRFLKVAFIALSLCLNWLRDDMSPIMRTVDADKKEPCVHQRMLLLSNILFVIENCTMIIIFYWFSPLSNTWYSLPVTVCVCSFSVIGAVARVAQVYMYFVTKETNRNNANSPVQQKDNTTEVGNEPSGESINGVTRFDMMAEYEKLVTNQAVQSTKGDSRSDMMTEYQYVSYV